MRQSAQADFVTVAAVSTAQRRLSLPKPVPGDQGRGNRYEACLRRLCWAMRQSAQADFVTVAAVSTARHEALVAETIT
jgi:hypothetical protein